MGAHEPPHGRETYLSGHLPHPRDGQDAVDVERYEEHRRLEQQVRTLKQALAQYGQHTLACAKRTCPGHACDCGLFEAMK